MLSDGKQLLATRYISNTDQEALSLYYTTGNLTDIVNNKIVMDTSTKEPGAILVASEPLTGVAEEWQEVPVNYMLLVDEKLNITLEPMDS